MGRWLDRIILLAGLAAVAACIEVAPRSSVPFHEARDRQVRYAAEITLAIKEARRDEISEAAANGRVVLPQMPEIWGVPPARLAAARPAGPPVVQFDAPPDRQRRRPHDLTRGCRPDDCERPLAIVGLVPAPLLGAAIAPAAAPLGADPGAPAAPYRFHLYFGPDSVAIDAAAQRVLEGAVGRALMVRPVRIGVAGHADRSGVAAYNQRLAQRRAAAVVGALIRAGVPPGLIETTALGERAPAVRTADGVAHRHNRRVEITLG
jgi:outer membrane protein OmpA-like peptidoglycan-associated protein